mgnify:CR=1 FL=1|jgi:hypothetical protein
MDGDRAGELLLEACLFQGGIRCLCVKTKTVYIQHPFLFKHACEYLLKENKDSECEKLGLDAISVLPDNLIIRVDIADLTARASINLKHLEVAYKCWEIAFFSDSTLNNYLRLFELPNYDNITKKAAKFVETLIENFDGNISNNNKQMRKIVFLEMIKILLSFLMECMIIFMKNVKRTIIT